MPQKNLTRRMVLAGLATITATPALAHEIKIGDLVLHHPWVRATAKGAAFAAGYIKITNSGTAAETLLSATIDGAKAGEIHETQIDANGVASMRMLSNGVPITPGGTIELKPLGMHIMFIGLEKPMARDTELDGTLVFQRAGVVKVTFFVEPPGASEPAH